MWRMSDTARALLTQTHTMATRVQVLHGGRPVHELSVYDPVEQEADGGRVVACQVISQANRPILRSLSLSLCDPDGTLTDDDLGDLLSPYEAEIKPWRGVVLPSGRVELVPLGVFKLTSQSLKSGAGGTVIDLTGLDRALIYQTPLPGPVTVPSQTPIEDAITMLLTRVYGGLSWDPWKTGMTCGPLLYESDSQAWDAALTLAESVGGWLYHDRQGVPVFAPYEATTASTMERFEDTLLDVSNVETSDEIHNSVVMQSASPLAGVIRATAEDTRLRSPTSVNSSFGRRQVTVTNEHLRTVSQAEQAAAARLIQELGRSAQVSWTCVPDPQTDVGDAVTVHRPLADVNEREVIVESITLSLSASDDMAVTARESVVRRSGVLLGGEITS